MRIASPGGGVATASPEESSFVLDGAYERELVRSHLDQVLASSAFRQSKRYAAVLRFLVERRINGDTEQLKERTIGIEVFGRAPDYDTSTDHVVRSAAAEIRRRLAQYYQEEGSQDILRIDLQRGAYLPQFRLVHDETGSVPASAHSLHGTLSTVEIPGEAASSATAEPSSPPSKRWRAAAGAAIVTACLGAILLGLLIHPIGGPLVRFWRPLLNAREPILLCVGTVGAGHQTGQSLAAVNSNMTLSDFHSFEYELVMFEDAASLARIAGLMEARGKKYGVTSESKATYADLQKGPAVLIGLMNNDWTERLVKDLRFSVERVSPYVLAIRDRYNPSNTDWSTDYSTPYLNLTKDYAIVVRSSDPKTDQMVVTIAGLSAFGTTAAGRLVTDPVELRQLDSIAPAGWEQKNLELVLSVDVIRGVPGRPVILASRFW